ncbi:protein phosphatase [Kitasatospora sp. NPDC048545]|uniref:protein-tyrosine phosphatase family protein n=1 Tax=Kitasatospora sp. NPDC048545 TaxID=3157208 RepID=UPI0033FC5436
MTDPTDPTGPAAPKTPTDPTDPTGPVSPPTTWPADTPGLLRLPSGRLLRGRGLSRPLPPGPRPDFGLYLLGRPPKGLPWERRWVRWPDFRLPSDRADAADAFREAWERSAAERVELACAGGRGRTGTALACIAVLDGVPAAEAVAYVREHYSRHAVETPWQRKFVERLA